VRRCRATVKHSLSRTSSVDLRAIEPTKCTPVGAVMIVSVYWRFHNTSSVLLLVPKLQIGVCIVVLQLSFCHKTYVIIPRVVLYISRVHCRIHTLHTGGLTHGSRSPNVWVLQDHSAAQDKRSGSSIAETGYTSDSVYCVQYRPGQIDTLILGSILAPSEPTS
jgi:hypothetical protein